MRQLLIAPFLVIAACQSSSDYAARPPLPPRLAPAPPPVVAPVSRPTADNPATQAFLQQEIERQSPPSPVRFTPPVQGQTNEGATNQWLQQQVEERNARNPERAPEPVYQVVEKEVPVYVDRPVHHYYRAPRYDYGGYGWDDCGEPVYGYRTYGYYGDRHRHSGFPVHTALGAGMGAIIGNQFHHQSGRGAAIGAGVGLLIDLFR